LGAILDTVHATAKPWTVHLGTGTCYHPSDCAECLAFILHLKAARDHDEPSLADAFHQQESYWAEHATNSVSGQKIHDEAYRDGIAIGQRRAEAEGGRDRTCSVRNEDSESRNRRDKFSELTSRYEDVLCENTKLASRN
jgi:hypothetical protein